MEGFVARYSRPHIVGFIAIWIVFAVLGLWLVGAFGSVPVSRRYSPFVTIVIGWFGLIVSIWNGMGWVKRLFDKQAPLRIGPSGICSRPWSDETIPWSEISDVTTWSYERQKNIVIHLRDPTRFPRRGIQALSTSFNKLLGKGDVYIGFNGTDRNYDDAMAAIMKFRI